MKKILLLLSLVFFAFSSVYADDNDNWTASEGKCDWIQLNTNVPFIGDCLGDWDEESTNENNAFPRLIWWMSKILVAFIIITSLIFLIAWGVLITMSWADQWSYSKWKDLIIRVFVGIFLLWASWVILYMINPNFFW